MLTMGEGSLRLACLEPDRQTLLPPAAQPGIGFIERGLLNRSAPFPCLRPPQDLRGKLLAEAEASAAANAKVKLAGQAPLLSIDAPSSHLLRASIPRRKRMFCSPWAARRLHILLLIVGCAVRPPVAGRRYLTSPCLKSCGARWRSSAPHVRPSSCPKMPWSLVGRGPPTRAPREATTKAWPPAVADVL